jgi:hypothetical protein
MSLWKTVIENTDAPSQKLFCSEQNIVWLVPYLVHELILFSPYSSYLLLNCYHSLSAVNYTSTYVLAPKLQASPRPWQTLLRFPLATCI